MNEIELFLLDYAAYDDEPLHLVISTAIKEKVCKTADSLNSSIEKLHQEGLISITYHPLDSSKDYQNVPRIRVQDLQTYIDKNSSRGFNGYPEKGGEYFIRTTDKGWSLIKD